jgi:Mrp family chromosome partitioning ATPase
LVDPSLSAADVLLRTNIPRLTILPVGQSVDAPTEIFASQRMKYVIAEITQRYSDRFIIIDSPPVLASSEPGVLAGYVGQVIMVVAANQTTRQAIMQSLDLVDVCRNVNFILNKVTAPSGPDQFGYYGYSAAN